MYSNHHLYFIEEESGSWPSQVFLGQQSGVVKIHEAPSSQDHFLPDWDRRKVACTLQDSAEHTSTVLITLIQ